MGKLRNGDDGVTINEVTVSHRATKNSPHDSLTWDPHGIRGVAMDGVHVFTSDTTVVRSVNISVGGVSFECDPGMLDVLADKEARDSLVTRSLEAQAEKERVEASRHEWTKNEERSSSVGTAWQCKRCTSWVVTDPGLSQENAPLPEGGCLGRAPTDKEKRQQNAAAVIQDLGRGLQALLEQARTALQNGVDPADVMKAFAGLKAVQGEIGNVIDCGRLATDSDLPATVGTFGDTETPSE